jgi:hypothetical protein
MRVPATCLLFCLCLVGCWRDQQLQRDQQLPPGFSTVDGAILETRVVIKDNGEERVVPLALTDDVRQFRRQLQDIFANTFVPGAHGKSPSINLLVTQHHEVPKDALDGAKAKFGSSARVKFTRTFRCGPFHMEKTEEGKFGIFQESSDGSPKLQASGSDPINLVPIFVDTLPDRIATMFVGKHDQLANALQAKREE